MIPPRFKYTGNTDAGVALKGIGRKFLGQLKRDLSFRDIPTGSSSKTLRSGETITCEVINNLSTVLIHVPNPKGKESVVNAGCQCGVYFSEGVITAIEPVDGYITPAQLYTVDVCQKEGTQITVRNCVSQDFHIFGIGDTVWCCLSIREVIASRPYYIADNADEFRFSAPGGAMGTINGYTYALEDDTSQIAMDYSNYDREKYFQFTFLNETGYYSDPSTGGLGFVIPWQWDLHRKTAHYFCDISGVYACLYNISHYYYDGPFTADIYNFPSMHSSAEFPNGELVSSNPELGNSYPNMCSLIPDISTNKWLCKNPNITGGYTIPKSSEGLFCWYAMKETLAASSGGPKPVFEFLFNLQIIEKL